MDLSTIVGIVAAFGLMALAIMSGGPLTLFIDPPSMIIVIGGTIGATFVHYPFREVFGAISVSKKTLVNREVNATETVQRMIGFATRARKEGILSLQNVMNEVEDPFLIKGLQMAVDGQEPEAMRDLLDREIEYIQERHQNGADIMIAMGTYAPAMGMIGTLIGLVQMLQTMNDPSSIGPAMAVALLTTFYGAIMANVLFLPMSGKLKLRSQHEVLEKTLIAEGMTSILAGENPRIMEQKLHAFLAPKHRTSSFGK